MVVESRANRIVMVDDDQDDLFLTNIAFRKAPYDVEFTGLRSGRELYEYIKNNGIGSIDLLLLDINMPIENGHNILAKLSKYPHFDEIKVVMFSTSKKVDDRSRALHAGAIDFMVKPSTQSEITSFLAHVGELLVSESQAMASYA